MIIDGTYAVIINAEIRVIALGEGQRIIHQFAYVSENGLGVFPSLIVRELKLDLSVAQVSILAGIGIDLV